MRAWERWNRRVEQSVQEDRMTALYRTRARRRLLVAAGAVSVLVLWADATVSWFIAPSDTAVLVNFVLLLVMLAFFVPAVTALNIATRGLASLPERRLDERQVAERLRAFTQANIAMRLILGAVLVAIVAATWEGGPAVRVPGAAVFLGVMALLWTHYLLPLLVAGWRLPDPPPDDPGDDQESPNEGSVAT
ncbi:hypothetical protein [Microbispora corallina]|nr:hypothetical protein [Microbispora corallina]